MNIQIGQAYSFMQTGLRDNQEDARFPNADKPSLGQRFFIVCDGVGGCDGGEIASSIVSETFGRVLGSMNFAKTALTKEIFGNALDAAYDALDNAAKGNNGDMATTMTFVCFSRNGCAMAHIGDSRIYHIRPGVGIMYRSDDHSLVNSMVHSGLITPEEAVNHPQSNVITRYMGATDDDEDRCMATMALTTDLKAGDYVLMCTDGVLLKMTDDEITAICNSDMNNEEKVRTMAEKCVTAADNNTAILIPIKSVSHDHTDTSQGDENCNSTRRIDKGDMETFEIPSERKRHKGLIGYIRSLMK